MLTPAPIICAAFNSVGFAGSVINGIDTLKYSMAFYHIDAPTTAFILLASAVPQFLLGKWNYAHLRHSHKQMRTPDPAAFNTKRHVVFPALRAALPHLLLSAALQLGVGQLPPEAKELLQQKGQQQAAQNPDAAATKRLLRLNSF